MGAAPTTEAAGPDGLRRITKDVPGNGSGRERHDMISKARTRLQRALSRGPTRGRRLVAVMLAVLAGVGLSVSATAPAAAETTVCHQLYYPDGAKMSWNCAEIGDLAGPKWYTGVRVVWNQPYPQGHTDSMIFCDYGTACSGNISDGGTGSIPVARTLYDTDSFWIDVIGDYPPGGTSADWCRRVWWNRNGGHAHTMCT